MNKKITELLVILGHTNDSSGTLSDDACSRVKVALDFLKSHRDQKSLGIVATGGYGDHFNKSNVPHGKLVSDSIRSDGIGNATLLDHVHSCGTLEDALGVLRLIRGCTSEITSITVVSSGYHIGRAKYLFSRLFPHKRLLFLDDGKTGTFEQRNHESKALTLLAQRAPNLGWLAENIDDAASGLREEIRHYDNLSYLALAASFSLVLIWLRINSQAEATANMVISLAPTMIISLLFFGIYWRLAGTTASARRTLSHLSFLTGQPHLGTSNNVARKQTPRITTSALVSWLIAWVSAFVISWWAIPP